MAYDGRSVSILFYFYVDRHYISYLGFGLEPVDDQDALKVDNCRVAIFFYCRVIFKFIYLAVCLRLVIFCDPTSVERCG